MKANWKVIGISAAAAALLVYPAMRLYKYFAGRTSAEKDGNIHKLKAVVPSYRGKNKSANRATHNGNLGHA